MSPEPRTGNPPQVPPFVEVAFNIPVDQAFTYRNLAEAPAVVGCRVEASLGRRKAVG